MGKYIRIKKSKNLRYKLISILYLLFISLSIIQIPIDWLRVSPDLRGSFEYIEGSGKEHGLIALAGKRIDKVSEDFNQLVGLDPESQKLLQPENYSLSDNFFINSDQGKDLYSDLALVRDTLLGLNEEEELHKQFKFLFEADLNNGLAQKTPDAWLNWKFQHVPATVARLELADLKMRLKLLEGEFDIKDAKANGEPNFILAYNIDRLHIGDTAYFVYQGKQRPRLDLAVGKDQAQSYEWEKDTLVFMALDTGAYHLRFTLNQQERHFHFNVLPGNFRSTENRKILANYTGLPFELELDEWQASLQFSCDCMSNRSPILKEKKLEVQPTRSGWCHIKGLAPGTEALAFQDSVYIHPLPAPLVYASGISANRISQSRLESRGEIELKVLFPNQPKDLQFSIEEVQAMLHYRDKSLERSFEAGIQLKPEEIANLQYIEIESVSVSGPDGTINLSDRLILNIIGDEV